MSITAKLAQRDTPAGRAYETKIIFFDSLILILGCVGLAVDFPPLLYVAAIGHIVCGFLQAPVKWLWPILEGVTVAAVAALLFGTLYLVQVYYYEFPAGGVVAYLKANWPLHMATAIVAGGIIGNLFTLPGITDQLVEYMDKESST